MHEAAAMSFWLVLGDIVILLGAAALLGMLCERLGTSAIIGALLAGVLAGPGIFNIVGTSPELMEKTAEIGVALLLFTIGLELSRKRLIAFGVRGLQAGVLQLFITLLVAWLLGVVFGLDMRAGFVVGAMVALSSTASVARVLTDQSKLDSQHGRVVMAVLIVQDLAIVPLLIIVSFLGESSGFDELAGEIGGTALGMIIFVGCLGLAGLLIFPRIFGSTARTGNRELPVVLALVICLLATWVAWRLGLSPALGAFVAGLVLADSPFARQIRADVSVFKTVFLTLFFATIGMLADIPWLLTGANLWIVLGVSLAIILGKFLLAGIVIRFVGVPARTTMATGLCLAQIGEFSFVIGGVAVGNQLIGGDVFQILTSASLVTLLFVPLLAGHAEGIAGWLEQLMLRNGLIREAAGRGQQTEELAGHVVVVGAGPAGLGVIHSLREAGFEPVVIDLNPSSVQHLQSWGVHAILGNAARRGILQHAGLERAKAIIVTLPDTHAAVHVIEQARNLAEDLLVVARARYNVHVGQLEGAGADVI
ncbi:MAG: cation:proton antiporter, partial [Phycisphaerales bacterium]|nr:cation:proton antiporter [Phycisphaerales bacterium]